MEQTYQISSGPAQQAGDHNSPYEPVQDNGQSHTGHNPGGPTGQVPPAPRPRTLERTDGPIAGVAGGLANYLEVDPVLVRLLIAGLTLAAPVMILLYIAAVIIIPRADAAKAPQASVAQPVPAPTAN